LNQKEKRTTEWDKAAGAGGWIKNGIKMILRRGRVGRGGRKVRKQTLDNVRSVTVGREMSMSVHPRRKVFVDGSSGMTRRKNGENQ